MTADSVMARIGPALAAPESESAAARDFGSASPSFADLVAAINTAQSLSSVAKRDLKSAVTRVAKWLERDLTLVPADPAWLRVQMTEWNGARFGISDASFSVALSQLRRALRLVAPRPCRAGAKMPLAPEWRAFKDAIRQYWSSHRESRGLPVGHNWLMVRLARFIRWCSEHDIAPNSVRDAVIVRFIDDIARSEIRGNIENKERGLRQAWNHVASHIAGWPDIRVSPTRKPTTRRRVTLRESAFPASFTAELDAYCANRGFLRPDEPVDEPDLTYLERLRRRRMLYRGRLPNRDEAFGQRLKPLAASSTKAHRRTLVMAATALVEQNVKPIEAIISIAAVVSLDGIACVVDALEERKGIGKGSSYPSYLVANLISVIARCDIRLDPNELSAIRELAGDLDAEGARKNGQLTPKNRARLTQFDDPDNFALLISCSEQEFDRLESERRRKGCVTATMACRAEAAIGNLLLCALPVRRQTLAITDWNRNFRAPTRRNGTATLVYFPEQTKTKRAMQVVLDAWKWQLLATYWKHYRPVLRGAERSTLLFPGNTPTGHRDFGALAESITKFVKRRTGLAMNLHLWRHTMGAMLLEEHRDIRLVEELLGHVPGSRATGRYVEFQSKWSAAKLDQITDARRQRGRYLQAKRERRYDRRRLPV